MSKGLVVHLQNILLQPLLLVQCSCRFVQFCSIPIDLKNIGFDSPDNFPLNITNPKLNLNTTVFLIYRIKKLWFIDLTKRFTKQRKGKSIKHRALTRTISTNDKIGSIIGKVYFSKLISGREKVFPTNLFK